MLFRFSFVDYVNKRKKNEIVIKTIRNLGNAFYLFQFLICQVCAGNCHFRNIALPCAEMQWIYEGCNLETEEKIEVLENGLQIRNLVS